MPLSPKLGCGRNEEGRQTSRIEVICGSVFLVFFAAIILEKLGYPALGKRCSNLGNMPESRTAGPHIVWDRETSRFDP